MTETKHTPGPFTPYEFQTPYTHQTDITGSAPVPVILDKSGAVLAHVYDEKAATLFAAAPELLGALTLVHRRMSNDYKLQNRLTLGLKYGHERECDECALFLDIDALIAKARGAA